MAMNQMKKQVFDDDDQEESKIPSKHIQMANTGYGGGFGADPQMKGYYQQQQQQMSSSHYVQKGAPGMTNPQFTTQQQKVAMSQPQRQPPPDVYVKQGAGAKGMGMGPSSNSGMMAQGYGQQQLTKEQQMILM